MRLIGVGPSGRGFFHADFGGSLVPRAGSLVHPLRTVLNGVVYTCNHLGSQRAGGLTFSLSGMLLYDKHLQ